MEMRVLGAPHPDHHLTLSVEFLKSSHSAGYIAVLHCAFNLHFHHG